MLSPFCYENTRNATVFFFFFQAEDGIRDRNVTGVQTCALPISGLSRLLALRAAGLPRPLQQRSKLCASQARRANPTWPTRFGMRLRSTSSACRITSKRGEHCAKRPSRRSDGSLSQIVGNPARQLGGTQYFRHCAYSTGTSKRKRSSN